MELQHSCAVRLNYAIVSYINLKWNYNLETHQVYIGSIGIYINLKVNYNILLYIIRFCIIGSYINLKANYNYKGNKWGRKNWQLY